MKIRLGTLTKESGKNQALVLFATEESKGPRFTQVAKSTTESLGSFETFTGRKNDVQFYRNIEADGFQHILVVGLGDAKSVTGESYRMAAAAAYKELERNKVSQSCFHLESLSRTAKQLGAAIQCAAEGLHLASYEFDTHKTDAKKKSFDVVFATKSSSAKNKKFLENGENLADCVNFSRWLGDNPGNKMTPAILASETQKKAKGTGLKVSAWDKARIKKEKMGGLYGVALGSAFDPRFIIMEYKGAAASKKPVYFVGKGLTFDCGGISIKPSAKMDEMKYDMCGGANVIGTMLAIARLKLKVNAVGLVPASENMPGPAANKPGDILTARNGKTVEVLNTDAEGRLILMDALSYATEKKPAAIFDAATLTGAMVVALGNTYTGFFTRNDKIRKQIENAGRSSGENVWAMPIHDDHVNDMKGNHADLQNISSFPGAGSSTAAAFLEQFVGKDIPWAHFDIAGSGWHCGNRLNYCPAKGATGTMIRTFVELAKNY